MPIKKYKPYTPSRRFMTGLTYEEITTSTPHKALTASIQRHAGRNSAGRISVRHQGSGHKKLYRQIDFKLNKFDIPATVESVEYDPYRTGFIALVCYADGERRYVLAHATTTVGDQIITSNTAKPIPGNRMEIGCIPTGLMVHNIEMIVGQGAIAVRSAGACALVLSQEGEYTQLKMSSGEIRLIHKKCGATIGTVSNADWDQVTIGKAGRSRWMGKRPTVLGSSMNPVDHPHGGGEGHQSVGQRKGPKTPWGRLARGVKTRSRKTTDRWILRTRAGKLQG
ncbi:50S ribosomal protein L2 [Candidatus Gracilibacteria bacterium]|nr:50S ribosomal protein L2 [Candidatus Gracilibacteria bacterium]